MSEQNKEQTEKFCSVLQYLTNLRPALPMSAETAIGEPPKPMSNSEIKRILKNKSILINGENNWAFDEEIPCYVWQLVFFPKSNKRRTTLV